MGKEVEVPTRIGSVRLIREIGRGGMGVVYEGWDELLARRVAVKFLLDDIVEPSDPAFVQFLQGARAEARSGHANVVEVYAAGVAESLPYTVMRYIDGTSVRPLLRGGSLGVASALQIASDVCAAAGFMHFSNVIHCDIKPDNTLVDRSGAVFVTDFGLAALRSVDRQAGRMLGTLPYMAPEMFDGRTSPQSDVYAIGITLYEMLSGSIPFKGNREQIRKMHRDESIPVDKLPEETPQELVSVIERATHKNPLFRYKSAEHLKRAIGPLHAAARSEGLRRSELAKLVLASQLGAAAKPSGPGERDEPPSSDGYFELLSTAAEQRRQLRGSKSACAARGDGEPARHGQERFEVGSTFAERINRIAQEQGSKNAYLGPAATAILGAPIGLIYCLKRLIFPATPTFLIIVWVALGFIPCYVWVRRGIGRRKLPPVGHCQACGYDLSGNTTGICPECGRNRSHISVRAPRILRCPKCIVFLKKRGADRKCPKCQFRMDRDTVVLRGFNDLGRRGRLIIFSRGVLYAYGKRGKSVSVHWSDVTGVRYDAERAEIRIRTQDSSVVISAKAFGAFLASAQVTEAIDQWVHERRASDKNLQNTDAVPIALPREPNGGGLAP